MIADLVSVQTQDGVRLDGSWRKPLQEKASQLSVDVVILHHGVGGNFYHPGMFDEYSDALLALGCAVLRVNNRGHDLICRAMVGQEVKRLGTAYERLDDGCHDWRAWVDFAAAAGYQRIGLWGHSLGAVKSIIYMAMQQDPRVRCVIAGSPPRFSHAALTASAQRDVFRRYAAQAQQTISQGRPETLMDVLQPVPLVVTAEVFIDKYGPDERYDVLSYLPKVQVPLLVMIGTEEAQTMIAFEAMPLLVEQLATTQANLTFASSPGADHAYTHQRAEVWNVVRQWLARM